MTFLPARFMGFLFECQEFFCQNLFLDKSLVINNLKKALLLRFFENIAVIILKIAGSQEIRSHNKVPVYPTLDF